jgi:hypothetical protein
VRENVAILQLSYAAGLQRWLSAKPFGGITPHCTAYRAAEEPGRAGGGLPGFQIAAGLLPRQR